MVDLKSRMKSRAKADLTTLSTVRRGRPKPPPTILTIFVLALALDFMLGFKVYPCGFAPLLRYTRIKRGRRSSHPIQRHTLTHARTAGRTHATHRCTQHTDARMHARAHITLCQALSHRQEKSGLGPQLTISWLESELTICCSTTKPC